MGDLLWGWFGLVISCSYYFRPNQTPLWLFLLVLLLLLPPLVLWILLWIDHHMSQQRQNRMVSPNNAKQVGDTTYTKIFVGGLAWETKRDSLKRYFEQFGDILEAVVITDRNTARSKGYGFVIFHLVSFFIFLFFALFTLASAFIGFLFLRWLSRTRILQ